jgi:hypothetical protein
MSKKHFSWLLLLTIAVAALVLVMPSKTGNESSIEQVVFLPGAAAKINDIDWLRLTSAGGVTTATLRREGAAWVVEEASGYRADWERLKTLLSGLVQAQVIETKTARPEYYPRLGVEDVSSSEASGVMVEFSADSGLPALIIGKGASGRNGQYARLQDSAESALIDRRLDVSSKRSDWLDKDVVDISDAEVVEVVINHPDGESIKALKASADDENFQLQEIPEGKEIKSDWNVNSLAGALAALSLESVAPDSGFDWNDVTRFRLLTADGLLLELELLVIEDGAEAEVTEESGEGEYWLRLSAGLHVTAIESGVEASGDSAETRDRAEAINSRVSGWAYRIPKHKFELMTKRKGDLLKPAESS